MQTLLKSVTLALCATVLFGCQPRTNASSPKAAATSIVDFQESARHNGSITFRSWEGKALRTDSDTELTFYPNDTVHMFEWGYALSSYKGTYHLLPDGHIRVQLKSFKGAWPDMVLTRDAKSLLLAPMSKRQGFVMGNRGGAGMQGGKGSFWPFRLVVGKDEQNVLKMIAEQGH